MQRLEQHEHEAGREEEVDQNGDNPTQRLQQHHPTVINISRTWSLC